MRISWLGHACFLIETKGVKLVTDPYDPSIGYPPYDVKADVVTESHQHFDHNAHKFVKGNPKIIDSIGEFEYEHLKITGIETFHDSERGRYRGKNIVYKISDGEYTLLHMGDIGHVPGQNITDLMKPVDVLMIPVGGTFTVDAEQAVEIVEILKPKLVIPMHYRTTYLKFEISSVDEFAKHFERIEYVSGMIDLGEFLSKPIDVLIFKDIVRF